MRTKVISQFNRVFGSATELAALEVKTIARIAFVVLAFVCSLAHASSETEGVLVRSLEATAADFEAALLARNLKPYSAEAENFFVDRQAATRLRESLARAQQEWLEGSLDSARAQFESAARLALASDWRQAQRESIHYAMARLAQLSASVESRNEWLRKAVVFAADLEPEPGVFPPPIYAAYQSERDRLLRDGIDFSPSENFPAFTTVKINGRVLKTAHVHRVRLAKGTYRVTALSDTHLPFQKTLDASELLHLHGSEKLLVSGDCANPHFEGSVGPIKSLSVLFAEGCVRSIRDGEWQDGSVGLRETLGPKLSSLAPPSLWPASQLSPSKTEPWKTTAPADFPTSPPPRLTERPWFWWGVAALAIGAGLAIRAHNTRSADPGPPEPTSSEGF
jgi:hypothetical protein